jgi:hypothetical protein
MPPMAAMKAVSVGADSDTVVVELGCMSGPACAHHKQASGSSALIPLGAEVIHQPLFKHTLPGGCTVGSVGLMHSPTHLL